MATYYWVGGSGYWGDNSGNNWSDSSGGPSYGSGDPAVQAALNYQPDPGAYDDVVFDANSNLTPSPFTVTNFFNPAYCNNLSIGGLSHDLTLTGSGIVTGGNVTFDPTTQLYLLSVAPIYMTGTCLFTTGGFSGGPYGVPLYVGYYDYNFYYGIPGSVTLNGSIGNPTSFMTILLAEGSSLNTNGYTVMTTGIGVQGYPSGVMSSIDFSTSNVYYGQNTSLNFISDLYFSYSVANATIHFAGSQGNSYCTIQAIELVGLYLNTAGLPGPIGVNVGSCGIFEVTAPSEPGVIDIYGSITVTGQFRTANTAGNRRVAFGLYDNPGFPGGDTSMTGDIKMQLVMNSPATATLSDVDFVYGSITGTASFPLTGTRIGNFGIANLTASTPKTVYWNGTGDRWFTDDVWALTSGGATNVNNFPLVQDTAIINDTNSPSNIEFFYNSAGTNPFYLTYVGAIDFSGNTTTNSIHLNGTLLYGDVYFSSSLTVNGSIYLFGSGVFQPNGTSTSNWSSMFIARTLTLSSDLDLTGMPVSFGTTTYQTTGNTLNLNGHSITTSTFSVVQNYITPSTIAFGSSTSQIIIAAPSGYGVGLSLGAGNIFTGTPKILYNSNSGNSSTYVFTENGYDGLPYCDFTYSGTSGIILSSTVTNITFGGITAVNFDLTGYTGTIDQLYINGLTGNFSIPSGSLPSGTPASISFWDYGGTKTINTNGQTISGPVYFGSNGNTNSTTWVLLNPLTSSNSFTFNSGILNLNGNDITADRVYTYHDYQPTPSIRQIQFGTNKINFTTELNIQTQPNEISYTGTLKLVSTGVAVGARYIVGGAIGSSYLDVTTSGSSGIILGTTSPDITYLVGDVVNVDLTGLLNQVRCDYQSGTAINQLNARGNFTFPASRSVVGGTIYFSNNSTITTNGCLIKNTIVTNGVGITVELADNLTNGNDSNTGLIIINSGNFKTNDHSVTVYAISIGAGSSTKTLNMGSSIITLTGSGPINAQGGATNFTITKTTGYFNLTYNGGKTFVGGGFSYPKLNLATNGNLTISGSNTFDDLTTTLTTPTANVRFTGGTTQTFNSFNLSGKSGYLIGLTSTNTTKANIKKNTTWYMGANSIDNGNNTNLTFTAGDGIDYLRVSYINGQTNVLPSTGNFFLLF